VTNSTWHRSAARHKTQYDNMERENELSQHSHQIKHQAQNSSHCCEFSSCRLKPRSLQSSTRGPHIELQETATINTFFSIIVKIVLTLIFEQHNITCCRSNKKVAEYPSHFLCNSQS
jgi:hypothetical protein